VHLVADPDLEGAVEDVEELVLAGVDVGRGPPPGAVRFSKSKRLPPVLSPVALKVIVSPTIQLRSPSPAATA
jgi:hypothetical protein